MSVLAQSTCPQINFLTAHTASLTPSPTTHIDVVRQPDGSYTGFEVTDAAPYRVVGSTAHFEQQFAACLPHTLPGTPNTSGAPAFVPGSGSQLEVSAPLSGGNILVARIGNNNPGGPINFDVFNTQHVLLQETTFNPPVVSLPPATPDPVSDALKSLALADLNGDGKLDVVAVFNTSPSAVGAPQSGVWTLLGNGDGTFQAGKRQALPGFSAFVQAGAAAVGDLNSDGKPDLVLSYGGNATGLVVALGNGDGTFTPMPASLSFACASAVAIADLNGDGKGDLVIGCTGPPAVAGVLRGNGDGTFQSPSYYSVLLPAVTGAGAAVAVGDVNSDGIPDIVTAGGSILFGDGTAKFPSRADYLQANTASVMLADFDGDGKTDLIFGTGGPVFLDGGTLAVLFALGSGSFVGAPVTMASIETPPAFNYDVLVPADFNGDGIQDLALVDGYDGFIAVLPGHGDGRFSQSYKISIGTGPGFAAAADFNHDGKPDLAVAAAHQALIYPGLGDGTFGSPYAVPVPTANPTFIAAPDFNGDGIPDLAVTGDGMLYVWLGKGDGTFGAPAFSQQIGTDAIAFADFNLDGKLDAAAANGAAVTLFLGNGDGTFPTSISSSFDFAPPQSLVPNQLVAVDFNRDGKPDLAMAYNIASVNQIAILSGDGAGHFAHGSSMAGGLTGIFVADVNGDKIPDLIFGASHYGPLEVALGIGNGTFEMPVPILAQSGWIAVADFDRNGSPDLAASYESGIVTLLNLSQLPAPLTVVPAATFQPGPLAPGEIASAFGEFGSGTGVAITVGDQAAALLYNSPQQVNFVLPQGLVNGSAVVTVTTATGKELSATVLIVPNAPALFSLSTGLASAYGVQVAPDGMQTIEPVTSPILVNEPGQTYLTLFGTGLGNAGTGEVAASVQGLPVTVTYAGRQGNTAGLDQVNILLPPSLAGTGVARINISAAGIVSNTVYVTLQ